MNQNLDKLCQDAKDIIQAIFDDKMPVIGCFSADCIEVKLDNAVHYLFYGGDVVFHALGNIERYLRHRGDMDWAIVFTGEERIGNTEHGRELIKAEELKPFVEIEE